VDYIKILNSKELGSTLAVKKIISKRPAIVLADKLHPVSFLPYSFNNIIRLPNHSIKDLSMAGE